MMRGFFLQRLRRSIRGFTLIEILVAAMIFSALLGALYVVLRGAFQLREKAFETVESGVPRDYVAALIRRDLSSLMPPVGLFAGPMIGEKTETDGESADRLEFYAASGIIRDQEPWGDVQKIEYYLAAPDESSGEQAVETQEFHLVRAVTRNLLPPVEEGPEEQRLLGGVQTLLFEYYDGEIWQETWDSTVRENETPLAVRMRIDFLPGETGMAPPPPIEIVCEIAAKPRTTESSGEAASVGGAP